MRGIFLFLFHVKLIRLYEMIPIIYLMLPGEKVIFFVFQKVILRILMIFLLLYRLNPPLEFGISIPMRGIVFYFLHFKVIRTYEMISNIYLRFWGEKSVIYLFKGGHSGYSDAEKSHFSFLRIRNFHPNERNNVLFLSFQTYTTMKNHSNHI